MQVALLRGAVGMAVAFDQPGGTHRVIRIIGDLMTYRTTYGDFPTASAVLFGLGLGGFLDDIVFDQMLQWHGTVSAWYPPISLENLRANARWEGLFHGLTCVFLVAGIALFWRKASTREVYWSNELLVGGALVGWGAFNLVEGLIDHGLLRIHHVNERVPLTQQPYWDLAFLTWGLLMVLGGRALQRRGLGRQRSRPSRTAAAKASR